MMDREMLANSGACARVIAKVRPSVWEFLLTVLVCAAIVLAARPLGEQPNGLGHRFDTTVLSGVTEPETLALRLIRRDTVATTWLAPSASHQRRRAQWINVHAGAVLSMLIGCAWLGLTIGRGLRDSAVKLPLIAALWCGAAWVLAPFGALLAPSAWPVVGAALAVLALVLALWRATRAGSSAGFGHSAASAWNFPGFAAFSALGAIWLLDLSSRGHLHKQFLGSHHIDMLWAAYAVLTLVAGHLGQLLAGFSRAAAWLDGIAKLGRQCVPSAAIVLALLLWIAVLAGLGQLGTVTAAGEPTKWHRAYAAMLAEGMRVPVWLALGWFMYRWVELDERAAQALVAAVALLGLLVAGLWLNEDKGPVLAQATAVAWILGGLILGALRRKGYRALAWTIAGVFTAGATAVAVILDFLMAPAVRLQAMHRDHQGPVDFLSVIYWLIDATPTFGFGLGKTSWCGYQAVADLITRCERSGGVPDQIQSDYVAAAWVAIWGPVPAALLLMALALWLLGLLRPGAAAQGALKLAVLRQWTVAGFVVTSLLQMVISVAGTFALLPMTGLAIPLLSAGGAGLLSAALFTGLSLNDAWIAPAEILAQAKPSFPV